MTRRTPNTSPSVDRTLGIGGSDIAAIVGLNPYRTAFDVWLEKLGLARPRPETIYTRRGRQFEAAVAEEYEHMTGRRVISPRRDLKVTTFRHPKHLFAIASPDFFVADEPAGVEVKITALWKADDWGEPGTDRVPPHVLCQVQWYLMFPPPHVEKYDKFERWDVAVFFWGQDVLIYRIAPDEEFQTLLLDAAERFWRDHILAQIPPPLEGRSAAEYIRSRWPTHADVIVRATEDIMPTIEALRKADEERARLDEEIMRLETTIKAYIADRAGIEFPGGRITWKKTADRTTVDWKAVAQDLAARLGLELSEDSDVVRRATTVKPGTRRFVVSWRRSLKSATLQEDGV